jgi:hypothetical protein
MSTPQYSQLHRRLLFHWTGKTGGRANKPQTRQDRMKYLDILASILDKGLRFSKPGQEHTEWIEKDLVEAKHQMLCFSEWGMTESAAHSGRYGYMGLGFTRRFVINKGGRPVIYVNNTKSDPFRKAILGLIGFAKDAAPDNAKVLRHAEQLSGYLKAYHFKKDTGNRLANDGLKKGKDSKRPRKRPEDDHLRIQFGGVLANLEDREWRLLSCSNVASADTYLCFKPGELAMIVFPDHQTLTLAMRDSSMMNLILRDQYGFLKSSARKRRAGPSDKPAVCLLSREMIQSM